MGSVIPIQDLVATLHRHYIFLSPFPREQEFPAPGNCQVARPSCDGGKVSWAPCLLQDGNRLIILHDVKQGCIYLLGFTGLML